MIVFVCDIKTGLTAADQDVANMLHALPEAGGAGGKQNAIRWGIRTRIFTSSITWALGDPIAVSAVHGHGTGDLLDACFDHFPPEQEEEEDDDVIKVAIIGKPNVGKSSLINQHSGGGAGHRLRRGRAPPGTRWTRYFENEQGQIL